MIRAGTMQELLAPSGRWIFIDVGFSRQESCGIAVGRKQARNFTFGEALQTLRELAHYHPVSIVIEAPLSVAFDAMGNPTARACEKRPGKSRAWHLQGGTLVTLAAMYMMETLNKAFTDREAAIYEGFVSFKQGATDHADDADLLRRAVLEGAASIGGRLYAPEQLKRQPSGTIRSPFELMGLDVGIPPVICSFT